MKRFLSLIFALCLLLQLPVSAAGEDSRAVSILIDGVPLEAEAYISDEGRTMVPLRDLAQALGLFVQWDQRTRTVTITSAPPEEPSASAPLVVLDPGHGGEASGAIYEGVEEKALNLAIAEQTARILQAEGVSVLMTRTGDETMDLYARTDLANSREAALFISVHCNASLTNPNAMGIYTAAYGEDSPGWKLAEILGQTMREAAGAGDMGQEARPDLAVLRTAQMPAALVECGYLSTAAERALLSDPAYQAKIAQGIAQGALDYLAQTA